MNILLAAHRQQQLGAHPCQQRLRLLYQFGHLAPEEVIAWTGLDLHNLDDPQAIASRPR